MFAMSAVCAILHTDQWESYWKHSRKIFTRTPEIKFLFTLSTRGLLTKAKQSVEYVHLGIGITLSLGVGSVAQLVEQRTENPCVGGSIPPLPIGRGQNTGVLTLFYQRERVRQRL